MSQRDNRSGALEGIRVADFSRVLAGPYATMLLADLGAEVVKIERPEFGDDTRAWGPPWVDGKSAYFMGVNRNKHSIIADLHTDDGLNVALEIASCADVLVENFRPGTMERLGLGYGELSSHNSGLIYCSISGFGAAGGAGLSGYDLLVQATGGLMSITGQDPSEPTKVGVALVDIVTGLHATVGILAALRHRDRTGQGQKVEVNLLSSLLSALTNQASGYIGTGVIPEAMGNRHPSIAPYEVFPTSDRPLVIAVGNDRQFSSLVRSLSLAHLAVDSRFATNASRVEHREELYAILSAALIDRPASEWIAVFSGVGVPTGRINNIAEAIEFGAQLGLEPIINIDDPVLGVSNRHIANPIGLSETPPAYRRPSPQLGQHTDEYARRQQGA